VTPTQVVSVFQTIANGGVHAGAPRRILHEGRRHRRHADEPDPVQVIKPETASRVSQMLENVYAQGTLAADINIPGYRLASRPARRRCPTATADTRTGCT
jgi:cell division protein FtsI (penicillin-binding protein 3)